MKELTREERNLLDRLTLLTIANGNTITPAAYDPTPEEYKMLYSIRIKLDLN